MNLSQEFSFFIFKKKTPQEYNGCKGVAWFDSLGWLLYSAVGIEGLKLLLNTSQRIGKFPVVQHDYGLLNPRQQV